MDKREIRAWKVAAENIEGSKHHQTDDEALVTGFYENKDKKKRGWVDPYMVSPKIINI